MQVLGKSEDLRTSACCTAKPPAADVRQILAKVRRGCAAHALLCALRACMQNAMSRILQVSSAGLAPSSQGFSAGQSSERRLVWREFWGRCHVCAHCCAGLQVPDEVVAKYYGCGSPLPQGISGLRCGVGFQRGMSA